MQTCPALIRHNDMLITDHGDIVLAHEDETENGWVRVRYLEGGQILDLPREQLRRVMRGSVLLVRPEGAEA